MKNLFDRTDKRGFYICGIILLYPTASILIIGTSLMVLGWVYYLIGFLISEISLAIVMVFLVIQRSVLSKNPEPRKPTGTVEPSWIRIRDIQAILMLLDLVVIALFLDIVRYSEYGQSIALNLMLLFLPMTYLGSSMFIGAFIALVDRKFSFPLSNPATILWVTSSLAKTLLELHNERGVMYLRKSLVATRRILQQAGRSSDSLDEAIGLLNFLWVTGVQVDYDKLLSFAKSVFGGDASKLELLPDKCKDFINEFDWFSKTKPLNPEKQANSMFGGLTNLIRALGGAGILGFVVAIVQSAGKPLESIGSALQPELITVLIIAVGLFTLLIPLSNLTALLNFFVRLSDLEIYEKKYLHPNSSETTGI
ncbi:MAG: hypothetical protein JRN52_13320 [Nitrososphaerota archaeon]|nr:hypothetical protein [Nitrososphaerota archaeon]